MKLYQKIIIQRLLVGLAIILMLIAVISCPEPTLGYTDYTDNGIWKFYNGEEWIRINSVEYLERLNKKYEVGVNEEN